jgi:hypothetical protein
MAKILDDSGSGYGAKVDKNHRVHTQSVTETEAQHAAEVGDAYNINTGNITFSAAGTLLYIKNNEVNDIVVEAIAVGQGSGTTSDIGEITVISNPTGGDLISDATAVAMNANRNFGSSKDLQADVYKGKSAGTITGGEDALLLYQGSSSRLFASITLILPRGSSIAVKIDPKLSSGTLKAYCAAIIHIKDPASKD